MFRLQALRVGTLAAASLLLESTLTRMLAVSQFYHFAFLVISLALLGYGASGTLLAITSVIPRLAETSIQRRITRAGFGFTVSVGVAYGIVNLLPFDSYSIAWDRTQILRFSLNYLALALPFLMSGFAAGVAISSNQEKSHLIYGANLVGSGLGALIAPLVLSLVGVPGAVILSGLMGLLTTLPMVSGLSTPKLRMIYRSAIVLTLVIGIIVFSLLAKLNHESRAPLILGISPYKGLIQGLRYPESEMIFSRWNAISRVDVLNNPSLHRLPGLSYDYQGEIPTQLGLSIDADTLQPVTLIDPKEFIASDYMPEELVFKLYPGAKTMVVEPGGGLGILQALASDAREVVVVQENPLEVLAVKNTAPETNPFDHPKVRVVSESSRTYFQREDERFDIIYFPLKEAFRPVTSGAYSLVEDFTLTIEAFETVLNRLSPDGILVVTRWLQTPPSESLRMATILMSAMDQFKNPELTKVFVMYRGIQTMTILVKPSGWTSDELRSARSFCEDRKFDIVWVPDIQDLDTNRFNQLPEPIYYQSVKNLLLAPDRTAIYEVNPFNISPSTDDHPFFFHFFKWEQTSEVLATIGHTWQPFGGSGFLVLFALLGFICVISAFLILLPLFIFPHGIDQKENHISGRDQLKALIYFSLLGFAFLFIEIPLIQQTILLFGHPTYAFTGVVSIILLFSGIGSTLANRKHTSKIILMAGLVVVTILVTVVYPLLVNATLGWWMPFRIIMILVVLAPMAIFMGLPFPFGLSVIERLDAKFVPWVWAVNGSVSVVASVVAAILVLSFGFLIVQLIGGILYAGAFLLFFFGFRAPPENG